MSDSPPMRNERKAYHVATAASGIVWGGEHGWERDEVGEHDLADALRRYVRDLKKQNKEKKYSGEVGPPSAPGETQLKVALWDLEEALKTHQKACSCSLS